MGWLKGLININNYINGGALCRSVRSVKEPLSSVILYKNFLL